MLENQELKTYDKLRGILINIQGDISNALDTIKRVEELEKKELYKSMPGIEGVFDGVNLVTEAGEKLEVPANYAAKSRLVFGDRLKIIEENGTKLFKQIQKPERLRVEGVLSKKEGKWHLLTPAGTYKISDIAAEFNYAEINDKAIGLVPKDNPNVAYAALDKVEKPAGFVPSHAAHAPVKSEVHEIREQEPKREVKEVKPVVKREVRPQEKREEGHAFRRDSRVQSKPRTARNDSAPRPASAPRRPAPKVIDSPINKEFVADITKQNGVLDDDDLR